MAEHAPKPEILASRKILALDSPIGKITLRQYEMLKDGQVIVQTILQEDNIEIANNSKVTHNRSFKAEEPVSQIKEKLERDWKNAQARLKVMHEEVAAYTQFKTRGQGNEMFSYETASNVLYECIEGISAGRMTKEECHHAMRNVLLGHHVLREAHTKMDKIEEEMAHANEAMDHVRHAVKQALKNIEKPEFGEDINTHKMDDAEHHCMLFASALSDTLDNVDKLWWMQANNISQVEPIPARDRARLVDNIRSGVRQAKQEYERLIIAMEELGVDDEVAEIQKVVEERSDIGSGIFPALELITSIVTREDLLRDTLNAGRVREKNK